MNILGWLWTISCVVFTYWTVRYRILPVRRDIKRIKAEIREIDATNNVLRASIAEREELLDERKARGPWRWPAEPDQ